MYIFFIESFKKNLTKGYKMTKSNLKVVNTSKESDKEKQKALEAAIGQIDQNFGKKTFPN